MMGRTIATAVAGVLSASACPVCRTDTGEAVRAGIFNGNFGINFLATILPFFIFFGIALVAHGANPKGRPR